MADPGDNYAVARQYLTPGAAGWWHPTTAQVVQTTLTTDLDGMARIDGELLGELDATGRLTSTYAPFTYDFGLVREQGSGGSARHRMGSCCRASFSSGTTRACRCTS